jgi:argininosuccinate lyase
MKLWGGRFEKQTAKDVEVFSSSLEIDSRMWAQDLKASIAHARMLGRQKIITAAESEKIVSGLLEIGEEMSGELLLGQIIFASESEDLHSEIEIRLFKKIGDPAKKLHTARSRNDQVATDTRMYLLDQISLLNQDLLDLKATLFRQAQNHIETILPGMTHLQHAQPISLAHHLLAYFWMFDRDQERLSESVKRISSLPLGSAALAGTGFPIDRTQVQIELGFAKVSENSLDAVSDRDFVIEFLSHGSLIMTHLSRLSEELILWSTPEFGFIELGDEVTTGSSIMPQKKNPDVAELIRGRVGRVYGALMGSLTMMKGLPLSYNRDMQEDKVHLFSGIETVRPCLQLMTLMLEKCQWNSDRMKESLKKDFSNATDLADDLVEKGLSFREAHEIVGRLVQTCLEMRKGLEDLTLKELRSAHILFNEVSLAKIPHHQVMRARSSQGGTSPEAVMVQLKLAEHNIEKSKKSAGTTLAEN